MFHGLFQSKDCRFFICKRHLGTEPSPTCISYIRDYLIILTLNCLTCNSVANIIKGNAAGGKQYHGFPVLRHTCRKLQQEWYSTRLPECEAEVYSKCALTVAKTPYWWGHWYIIQWLIFFINWNYFPHYFRVTTKFTTRIQRTFWGPNKVNVELPSGAVPSAFETSAIKLQLISPSQRSESNPLMIDFYWFWIASLTKPLSKTSIWPFWYCKLNKAQLSIYMLTCYISCFIATFIIPNCTLNRPMTMSKN